MLFKQYKNDRGWASINQRKLLHNTVDVRPKMFDAL